MRLHLGLLLGTCVLAIVLSAVRWAHVASRSDFETVARAVRAAYQQGDLIVAVPFHQGTPRLLLGDLPIVEPRGFTPELLRLHRRILLIATAAIGPRNDLVRGIEALGDTRELAHAGPVRASVVTIEDPIHPSFELRRGLRDVRVTADLNGVGPIACDTWMKGRWTCPRAESWNWVGSTTVAMETGPQACVWLHPLDRNRTLELTLPETSGTRLLLAHGFATSASGHAPVTLSVSRGDEMLRSYDIAPRSDWRTESVDLDRGSGPITLSVRSRDNGGAHFCANAWVVE